MLEALAQSGAEALAVGGGPPPGTTTSRRARLRVLIRETIEQTAAQGNVVIVAHAASHALPQRSDALRVLVTASPETRASGSARRRVSTTPAQPAPSKSRTPRGATT